jgi:hypothetical protein
MMRWSLMLFCAISGIATAATAQPTPGSQRAFDTYIRSVELRLDLQHQSDDTFLAPSDMATLQRGERIIEQLSSPESAEVSGSLLHHWRGTAFAPGATAEDFERLMQDFPDYSQHFSPEVLRARLTGRQSDRMQASMRVRQQHVITVVLDTDYDISYGRLDSRHRYSTSRSTRIAEIQSPGTAAERALPEKEEHGYLWRMNTYWSYQEKDGGLYMQIESVTLTRDIPHGLGWLVGPYVERVPRESLEFTLRSVCDALRNPERAIAERSER